jgi:hypothetical protein
MQKTGTNDATNAVFVMSKGNRALEALRRLPHNERSTPGPVVKNAACGGAVVGGDAGTR